MPPRNTAATCAFASAASLAACPTRRRCRRGGPPPRSSPAPPARRGRRAGRPPPPPQRRLLSQPLDILAATPGRLLDHMERGRVDYSRLEVLVLDEADRMLDMGFIHAVEEIAAATPATRPTLLFSATLEGNIAKLASRLLKNPKRIQIATQQERHENIEQRLHHVDDGAHKHRLLTHLRSEEHTSELQSH